MGQAQPVPDQGQPAERLLRPAAAARLPHPNACLTCPDFQTTPEFLDTHRRQATVNLRLITRAEANGQTRLAANLRQVQDNLERIIPALEALPACQEPGDDQS